ncbi:MAG: DUF6474 family protein [Haloechinothrix sp.]
MKAEGFTRKKAKNVVRVAKVIWPALVPVLAPFAVRATSAVREAYDRHKARRLGIDIDSLGGFQGRGARLRARIAGLSDGIGELRAAGTAEGIRFADRCASTVRPLDAAIRAAERMPAPRRKAAHRAVAEELDRLEAELLHHLGVD